MKTLRNEMIGYANDMISGRVRVNKARIQAAERFLKDLENPDYYINEKNVQFCILLIEESFRHNKGDLRGQPLKLEMWQKFILYNLIGFELSKSPGERRFKETFIYLPRKNGKTFFASALAWALSVLEMKNYSVLYIIATKLDRAREAFDNIRVNLKLNGMENEFKILNSRSEYSITTETASGALRIQALAANSENADGLNAPFIILDEIHAYKSSNDYYVYRQAMKAYTNKLLIGITTAGKDMNSFCYSHLLYCKDIISGKVKDEQFFVFICEADDRDDYTNPYQHEIANPNYGVSLNPLELINESEQAQYHPMSRTEFLNKSLNIYVNSLNSYFEIEEFRESDSKYDWTIDDLAKLKNVKWYGGADLSKMHDLTAVSLYGNYKGVDIVISHAFFPRTEAMRKAEQDRIPLFGWEEDGLLTLVNNKVMDYNEPVKWFLEMRKKGFKIAHVGFDPRYGREFEEKMKKKRFKIVPTPQYKTNKSQGFRRIERKVKSGEFYYLHSEAYEYCVNNIKAIEDIDDQIQFDKIAQDRRIDIFDASVFACYEYLESYRATQKHRKYLGLDDDQDTKE